MALPKGLNIVPGDKEKPFLTLCNTYITFSKSAVEALGKSPFVHMYQDVEKKIVAFQACEEDMDARVFYKPPKEGKQSITRIIGKKNSQILMDLAGIDDCGSGIRIYGEPLLEDSAILFPLANLGKDHD